MTDLPIFRCWALLLFLFSVPICAQRMFATAHVNLVDGPYQDRAEGPGEMALSMAGGNGGQSFVQSTWEGRLRAFATSIDSSLSTPAVASGSFRTGFGIEGNTSGVELPLNFNFSFDGSFSSQTDPGDLGSVAGVNANFSVVSTTGRRAGSFGLTTQGGLPVFEYSTGDFGSGTFRARATPKVGVGVDVFELTGQDFEDLGLELEFETEWEEFEVSALEGAILSAISALGIPRLGILPGVEVDLGFDVNFFFESSVPIPVTVSRRGFLLATLGVVASSSPANATAITNLRDTFKLESVTVPATFDAVDLDSLQVVLDSGEVYRVEREPDICTPGGETLCLNQERFRVEVEWRDFDGNVGTGSIVPFGSDDSGLFYFFDPDNWEMLVKVVDGCAFNERFWVFAAATTNVEYTLRVRDTETGATTSYFNPLGTSAPAVTDIEAFATCSSSREGAKGAQHRWRELRPASPKSPTGLGRKSCAAGLTNLCLNQDRFSVEVEWRDFEGLRGSGQVVPFGSDDSGLLWFFDPDNWEMLIKVIDGCGLNGNFWVFSAATTNVEYTLRVTDTATGQTRSYANPLGTAAPAITDTAAFAACP